MIGLTSRKAQIATRMAAIVLAATAAVGLGAQPSSAKPLYFRGAAVHPTTFCNADQHFMSLRTSVNKDPAYSTQMVQIQYRITNLWSGARSFTQVITQQMFNPVHLVNVEGLLAPAGGQYKVDYIVRFGMIGGYNAWSAWTPTDYLTSWGRYLWWNQPTTRCFT